MGLLRLILAISVVIAHSNSIFGFDLVGGQVAVQAFYIISGFYMTLILNEKYIGSNSSYKLFITNRLLRLYPIYWFVFLLTFLFSIAVFFHSQGDYAGSLQVYRDYYLSMDWSSLFFLAFANVFMLFQDVVMFLGLDTSSGYLFFTANFHKTDPMLYNFLFVPQAWTIGIEITFYLIAPFIVRKNLKIIFILIFLSLVLRFFLFQNNLKYDPWTYRFFPTELVFFLLGIVSYHNYKKLKSIKIKGIYLKLIFIFTLIFTLFYSFIPFSEKIYIYLFLFFLSLPFIFILSKNWKKDRFIGELSYPVYISHIFLSKILSVLSIPFFNQEGLKLTLFAIVFSIILNELLTKRIEKIRQKRLISR